MSFFMSQAVLDGESTVFNKLESPKAELVRMSSSAVGYPQHDPYVQAQLD